MTSWVGSISYDQRGNWAICKRESLFGSNTRTALRVRAGDELFIWGSQQGWLGRCRAIADARAPESVEKVPWPDPERYTAVIPMEVIDEPRSPVEMSGYELQRIVGIGTVRLPQFPRIDDVAADRLADLLSAGPRAQLVQSPTTAPVEIPTLGGRRGELLAELRQLRVDQQLGSPAPYQQLVLIWSIVRAVEGGERVDNFSDVRDELRALLAHFAVGNSRPDPELPWFALRNSGWWQFFGDVSEAERRGGRDFVRRMDPAAGLSAEVFGLVRSDDVFSSAAVQVLSEPLRQHPQWAQVASLVQRSANATSVVVPQPDLVPPSPSIAVELDVPIATGRVYDRDEIHEVARREGLPPGNRMSGITVVGNQLSIFWNPYKALYANRWIDEPTEFTYSGEGSNGDQDESTGGNKALIEHETSGAPVSVFIKTRRDGSAWRAMGPFVVVKHTRGISDGQDGIPRSDLRFRLVAQDRAAVPALDLPAVPVPAPPRQHSEEELWAALERVEQTGDRRRATVTSRNRRVSDPLKTAYVVERANRYGGACELCGQHPGWVGEDGRTHLQAHHIDADIDLVDWIAALCGTCHDRMHHDRHRAELPAALLATVRRRQQEQGRPVRAKSSVGHSQL